MKKLAKQVGSAKKQTMGSKLSYIKKNWQLYVFFLMPALLLTIIFKYLPMGGLLIAFEDYNVIKGVLGSPWVGLEYFQRFLSSPDFMNYLLNTLKLSIFGLLWSFPIPIILALLLNRIRKAGIKKKIQLLIYAPNFISVIVLCGMVRMFLSPVGPLNRLLGMNTNWMTMPSAFRTIYIASGIWQGAGWASIMYTAALSNASKELEEAAGLDGCNIVQLYTRIVMPMLKPGIVVVAIWTFLTCWNEFFLALCTMTKATTKTLPLIAQQYKGVYNSQPGILFAILIIITIPMVIFYCVVQKQFVKGMTAGAVKG